MEMILGVHRKCGTLSSVTEEAEVERHMLPASRRFEVARTLLERKREEFLLIQKERFRKVLVKKQVSFDLPRWHYFA